jgi:hypothetical protein
MGYTQPDIRIPKEICKINTVLIDAIIRLLFP